MEMRDNFLHEKDSPPRSDLPPADFLPIRATARRNASRDSPTGRDLSRELHTRFESRLPPADLTSFLATISLTSTLIALGFRTRGASWGFRPIAGYEARAQYRGCPKSRLHPHPES